MGLDSPKPRFEGTSSAASMDADGAATSMDSVAAATSMDYSDGAAVSAGESESGAGFAFESVGRAGARTFA